MSKQEEDKRLTWAIHAYLEEHGYAKAARALHKALPEALSTPVVGRLRLDAPEEKSKAKQKEDSDSDSDSDSSSSSSSESEDEKVKDKKADKTKKIKQASKAKKDDVKKKPATVSKAATTKKDDSSDDSDSSGSDSSDDEGTAKASIKRKNPSTKEDSDSSSSDDDSDSEDEKKPPAKKAKVADIQTRTAVQAEITPEEAESDSDVSDTDVSDVSSDSDSDDSSSSDSDSEDEEAKQKADTERREKQRVDAKKRASDAAKAALAWKPTPKKAIATVVTTVAGTDGAQALSQGTPFSRVDSDFWGEKAQSGGGAIADNSYEAGFGQAGFGQRSSEKLLTVRGKDFRHEKTKRKRSFNGFSRNGGQIDSGTSNSTKFKYDSE